jgi:hypothetical protein
MLLASYTVFTLWKMAPAMILSLSVDHEHRVAKDHHYLSCRVFSKVVESVKF